MMQLGVGEGQRNAHRRVFTFQAEVIKNLTLFWDVTLCSPDKNLPMLWSKLLPSSSGQVNLQSLISNYFPIEQ